MIGCDASPKEDPPPRWDPSDERIRVVSHRMAAYDMIPAVRRLPPFPTQSGGAGLRSPFEAPTVTSDDRYRRETSDCVGPLMPAALRRTGWWRCGHGTQPGPPNVVTRVLDGGRDVSRHRRQLRTPAAPVMLTAGREVEMPVVAADVAVVLVERAVAAGPLGRSSTTVRAATACPWRYQRETVLSACW